jgi:hypothetical protein
LPFAGWVLLAASARVASADMSIDTSTTWTRAGNPYIVNGVLTVGPSARLTIESGVVVRFYPDSSIVVKGHLEARGTAANRVVFTSYTDPEYGGEGAGPVPGYWKEIQISNPGAIATASFDHCLIRNGGDLSAYEGAHLIVRNSRIEHSDDVGLGFYGTECTVEDSVIDRCGAQGILVIHNSASLGGVRRVGIYRNTFTNCGGPAIHGYTTVGALDCQGNTGSNNQLNGIALQCQLTRSLTLSHNPGFPYVVISSRFSESQSLIAPGTTTNLMPGTIMKFAADGIDPGVLWVRGRLTAVGTPSQRIVFTSLKDDIGGDTNGDGASSSPRAGDWCGIRIGMPERLSGPAVDGVAILDQCDVRYSGASNIAGLHVATEGSTLTATACKIEHGAWAGVFGGGSANVRVNNSIIQSNLFGVRQARTATIDARRCYWGHTTGPRDSSDDRITGGDYNPGGLGDPVTDYVRYRPFLTAPGYGQPGSITPRDGQGGSDVTQIIAGEPIPVSVNDPDADTSATDRDKAPVTIIGSSGDRETVLLDEKEIASGEFLGSIDTTWGTPNVGDGTLQVVGGDVVTVIYHDQHDATGAPKDVSFTVTVRNGNTATADVPSPTVVAGDTVPVTITDKDLDETPGGGNDTVTLPVTTSSGDTTTVVLSETGTPGAFTGEIKTEFGTTPTAGDDSLQVKGGDQLPIQYTDTLDGSGKPNVPVETVVTVATGVDGSLSTPPEVTSAGGVPITVTDADLNRDTTVAETVTVTAQNPANGDTATVVLTETGPDTGVFQGTAPTVFGETAVTDNQKLDVKGNDTVQVVYTDGVTSTGQPNVIRDSESTVKMGAVSDVGSGSGQIIPGDFIDITITDPDRNLDPNAIDTITVIVRTSRGDEVTIVLTETGPNTGVFTGRVPTEFSENINPTDGVLQIIGGDTIQVIYRDPLDSQGRVDHDTVITIEVRGGASATLTVPTGQIPAGAPLPIRIQDADLIGGTPPTVQITTTGGDAYTATLTPVDDTGAFAATVPTVRNDSVDTADSSLQVLDGQTITIRYTDVLDAIGRPDQVREATVGIRNSVDGTLETATGSIRPAERVNLTVTDADMDFDPGVRDTIVVSVTNPDTGESEAVTLTETQAGSGVFTGGLETAYSKTGGAGGDNILRVRPGNSLQAGYNDIAAGGVTQPRSATIAVTGDRVEHDFTAGRSLIAIPAQLFGPGVGGVLGIDGGARKLATYDTLAGAYETFTLGGANPLTSVFRPAVGYFAHLDASALNQMREYGSLLPQDGSYRIPLHRGWNLIGSPFVSDAGWNRDLVRINAGGIVKSLRQAAIDGQVIDYLWGVEEGRYKLIADLDMNLPGSSRILRAWNGYWILSAVEGELLLPAPTASAASIRSVGRTTEEGGWAFMLTAQRGDAKDGVVVGARGAAGVAAIQIQKPPALPGSQGVSLSIVGEGAGDGPKLAYDVRTAAVGATTTSYRVRVDAAPSSEPVILAWNDLRGVPARVKLLLVDEASGERRYMRTTSAVRVTSEDGKPRFFRVTVEPAGEGLRIMGLRGAPARAGGVAVTYSLSTSAQVEMTVLSLSGKPIRRLPQATVSTKGLNNSTWDGRDSSGRTVPAGTYLIELSARTDIGEVAKTAVPVVVR